MTLESVEAHVAQLEAAAQRRELALQAIDLCNAWAKGRPIIMFLLSLPFIPSRWRPYIAAVTDSLDVTCGVAGQPAKAP